jgi:hypothetical protein
MAVLLLNAGREAIAHRWVLGVSELDNSRLLQLVPAAGGGGFAGGVVGALIGSALTVVVVLWLMGQRAERSHAAGQIAVLGALVYSAMLRSSDPSAERRAPGESRSPASAGSRLRDEAVQCPTVASSSG